MDFSDIHYTEVSGKKIHTVCGTPGSVMMEVDAPIPTDDKLFNFDVELPNGCGKILVLDPYGDETLSSKVRKGLFSSKETFPIGINRTTGQIYRVGFGLTSEVEGPVLSLGPRDTSRVVMVYSDLQSPWGDSDYESLQVPDVYLPRLDELKSQKRPFSLSLPPDLLCAFVDQEVGYRELRDHVHVNLWFLKYEGIEISSTLYRNVGRWQDCVEDKREE